MLARVLAWCVHAYTALGAVLSYLMVSSIVAGDYRTAFLWMITATAIDSTDGWLARAARVKQVLPGFDGARLDDIVDYLTFVFVPALLVHRSGVVQGAAGQAAVVAMLLSSAYGFSRADAKTPDHFFTGFPSYWNIVAFYLYAARLAPPVNAAILIALAVLVFVPVGYVYPSRTPVLRSLTLVLSVGWGLVMLWMVWRLPDVLGWLVGASLLYPAYYAVLSLVLHRRRRTQG